METTHISYSPTIYSPFQEFVLFTDEYNYKSNQCYRVGGFPCRKSCTVEQSIARFLACDYKLQNKVDHGSESTTGSLISLQPLVIALTLQTSNCIEELYFSMSFLSPLLKQEQYQSDLLVIHKIALQLPVSLIILNLNIRRLQRHHHLNFPLLE